MRTALLITTMLCAGTAWGSEGLDTGDTAWILTSTALVLFMTLPGLALFYGGLVRAKNILSILMQCMAITAVISVLWVGIVLYPSVNRISAFWISSSL